MKNLKYSVIMFSFLALCVSDLCSMKRGREEDMQMEVEGVDTDQTDTESINKKARVIVDNSQVLDTYKLLLATLGESNPATIIAGTKVSIQCSYLLVAFLDFKSKTAMDFAERENALEIKYQLQSAFLLLKAKLSQFAIDVSNINNQIDALIQMLSGILI